MSSKQISLQVTDLSEAETMNLLDLAIEHASERRVVAEKEASLVIGGAIKPTNMDGATCGMICPDPLGSGIPLIIK